MLHYFDAVWQGFHSEVIGQLVDTDLLALDSQSTIAILNVVNDSQVSFQTLDIDAKLDRRKHSLLSWLTGSISFKIEEDYPIRLLATGIVHSHPPSHRAHLGSIPNRFMTGSMSYMMTYLTRVFQEELSDPKKAFDACVAWNKLLMVQLDIMQAGYINETPTEPTGDSATAF